MKKAILILGILTTILSCEPLEVEVKDSFNFEVTIQSENTGKINSEIPLKINITPERIIQGTTYTFSFTYIGEKGTLLLGNQILQTNQVYPIEHLSNQLSFVSISKGKHQIDFTIKDSNDNEVYHTVDYNIFDDNSFDFNAESQSLSVLHLQEIPFNFSLSEIDNGSPEVLTYSLRYEANNLQAVFLYNEIEYGPGDIIKNISLGEFRGILKSSDTGTSPITFFITSSSGKTKSVTHQIEFKPIDFDFSISFENDNPTKSEYTIANFSIDEMFESNQDYEFKYFSSNDSYKLFQGYHCGSEGDQSLKEGVFISVAKEFSLIFSGCNKQYDNSIEFTFIVKNGTLEKEFTKIISIKPYDFEFSITPNYTGIDLENVNKTSKLVINYSVFLDSDEYSINNYYMKVTSSLGSGTIEYVLDTYGNSTKFQLIHQNTFFTFTSGISGEATLTFELTAVDSGLTKTKTMKVRFVD